MRLIGILGGTFDPVHYGHIRLALEACDQLQLDQVKLIPLNIPPHRPLPVTSSKHRCNMLQIAIVDKPRLCIDLREIENDDVSYTIDTLKSVRKENIKDSLCLILGRDAFDKIDSWKNWQELLDYSHIIVANRPGEPDFETSTDLNSWIENNKTIDIDLLKIKTHGNIFFIEIPMLDISSSDIRTLYSKNKKIDDLLPTNIISYIKENQLYLETA